jgi:hypothetical protein
MQCSRIEEFVGGLRARDRRTEQYGEKNQYHHATASNRQL